MTSTEIRRTRRERGLPATVTGTSPPRPGPGLASPGFTVRLWAGVFGYVLGTGLLVQLVILPRVFPHWDGGHGLLVATDALAFHRVAVQQAMAIRAHGWSVWELKPGGHLPSGVASAVYALTRPEPWTVLPLNAALHATAAVVLLGLLRRLGAGGTVAMAAIVPFVVAPSALQWTTQLHRDPYSILGALLFIRGWTEMAGAVSGRAVALRRAVVAVAAGTGLVWAARPYVVQILLALVALIAVLLTAVALGRRGQRPLAAVARPVAVAWLMVVGVAAVAEGGRAILTPPPSRQASEAGRLPARTPARADFPARAGGRAHSTEEWRRSAWLPASIEARLYTLSLARRGFLKDYVAAGSNVDTEVVFHSAADMLAYVPRAAAIAFLAPFPAQWFSPGASAAGSGTMMRRLVALEMLGLYAALAFVPLLLWQRRQSLELWVVVTICAGTALAYAFSVPNVGALHRMRYVFVMTLAALGIAAAAGAFRELRGASARAVGTQVRA